MNERNGKYIQQVFKGLNLIIHFSNMSNYNIPEGNRKIINFVLSLKVITRGFTSSLQILKTSYILDTILFII